MATGTVKWFNTTKGYGFIEPAAGGKDVFVHITEVHKARIPELKDGDKVTFDTELVRGKTAAVNLSKAASD